MAERCPVCSILLRPARHPRPPTCERSACIQEYRRRIQEVPGARPCPVCGRRIDPDVPGESCGDVYCREELGSRLDRMRREQERREKKDATALQVEAELRRSGEFAGGLVTAALPAHDRPLEAQHPSRRTLFAERLAGIVEDAAADPEGPTGDPTSPEAPTGPADVLARAACASCRGHCCRHGADHAFLRPATLRRYLKTHPEETPAQALQSYLRRIPADAVAGSCLYHGRQGCTLPRGMRSDVCNRYLCEDLERLQKTVAAREGAPPIVAVGFDEDRLVRVSLLGADGVRTLSEGPPSTGTAPAAP
ncbi:MAG: hypothetical protein JO332_16250 [Planctomycetaceae bacterium]|nr:hypothetical protein [Planctomycetaceae bacterium]